MSKEVTVKEVEAHEDYGACYLAIQTNGQPTERLRQLIGLFAKDMSEYGITPYVTVQFTKPPGGGCVPGQQGCP